jgi:hypothetical protein
MGSYQVEWHRGQIGKTLVREKRIEVDHFIPKTAVLISRCALAPIIKQSAECLVPLNQTELC